MMTTPATTILDEVCTLISVQLDILEAEPTSLTYTQLWEFHSRSEKIKVLCEELEQIPAQGTTELFLVSVA